MRVVIALIFSLLPLLGQNIDWVTQIRNKPEVDTRTYNFSRTNGSGVSGDLSSTGKRTLTFAPCPLGVNWNNTNHYLYISGGTGTAEAVLIDSAGPATCTSGAASGTVVVTTANTHTGAYTVASATAGIQEAVNVLGATGGRVVFPKGNLTMLAPVRHGAYHSFAGQGRSDTAGSGTYIDATAITSDAAFVYESPLAGGPYTVISAIRYEGFTLKAKNAFRLNRETPPIAPQYQALVEGATWERVYILGTYDATADASAYTAAVPTLAGLRVFGTGVSCNACYSTHLRDSEIKDTGIGVVWQGDENSASGNRFNGNATHIWVDATLGAGQWHGGTNKIHANTLIRNIRVSAIRLIGATRTDISGGNYFEAACSGGSALSAQFLRSTGGYGNTFSFNRVDDPNGGGGCLATTPIIHMDDYYGGEISHNFLFPGVGPVAAPTFAYTNYNQNYPNLYRMFDNYPKTWPTTNAPGVLVKGEIDPMVVSAQNVAADHVSGFATFPWVASAVTGRYVLDTKACCWAFRIYPANTTARNYAFKFTGLRVGTGAGFAQITYVGAGNTVLFSGNLSFTSLAESETRQVAVQIPAAEAATGYFKVEVDSANGEFERIEATPLDMGMALPPYAFATLPTVPNGSVVYCSDCAIASPCAGAGTGAIAKRLNGAWVCN